MTNTHDAALSAKESLIEALRNIRFLLTRENEARLIIAKPTLQELKQQKLPDHLKTSIKKRTGPRVSVRGSRHSPIPRMASALWPEDHLRENTLPSIACVVRGAADLHIADYVMHCQTGDFVFYPAGIAAADGTKPHFEGPSAGRRCSLLWIFPGRINGEGLECFICQSLEHTHSSFGHLWCRNRLLAELFQGISEEEQKQNHQESIFHLLSVMLFLLQREISVGNTVPAPYYLSLEDSPELGHDPIQQACAYIKAHLDSILTIDIIAKHVCISSSVFTRRFKQQTGQTFNQYCTALRMELAATLLTKTEWRIIDVSKRIGLTDCQFRLLARQYWGCSPREFRLKNN